MSKTEQERTAYKNEYARRAYDRILLQFKKNERVPARIDTAVAAGHAPSRQAYIIDAIKQRLDADGIPPADATLSDD